MIAKRKGLTALTRLSRLSILAAAGSIFGSYANSVGLLPAALALQVDKIEDVPEAQRPLYKEANGKFVLDVDGVPDVTGLKSALDKERTSRTAAEKQIATWSALGKTPEEIQALIAAQAEAERKKLEANGEWDKVKQGLIDAHKRELDGLSAKLTAKDAALGRYLVDAAAATALASAKGSTELLLPHIRSTVKVVEENGDFVVRVVDKSGTPRVKNGNGDPFTIGDLVEEMRQSDVFGRAFEPSGISGGGSHGNQGNGGGKTIKEAAFNALNPKDRAARMKDGYQIVP